ncbi:hypothetical protein [Streptomyces sp. NPDC093094]|uniref:hypothetical protein n=1 Tax=Streptomyces sp. NPDC093094 TaxID=3366026 RepID=UPI00382CFF9F
MDILIDRIQRLRTAVSELEAILSAKTGRLPSAVIKELQDAISESLSALYAPVEDLRWRRLDQLDTYQQAASRAVDPYESHEVMPLRHDGFLTFAHSTPEMHAIYANELDERYQSYAEGEITIDVFIDGEEGYDDWLLENLNNLVRVLGYEEGGDAEIERGSIWRRSRATAQFAGGEILDRLKKAERALELAQLELRQAEVDSKEAAAVNDLLSALEAVPRACVRVGSILVIKFTQGGESVVIVRNLTQVELHAVGRFPEIQRNPENVLQALVMAVSELQREMEEGGESSPGLTM